MTDDKQWVVIPGVIGWVREHDPETESGIAPIGKYRELPAEIDKPAE